MMTTIPTNPNFVHAFPIMESKAIKAVPWGLAELARAQLLRNHDQTLERLAERGGLAVAELVGALRGLDIRGVIELAHSFPPEELERRLALAVESFQGLRAALYQGAPPP